MLRSTDFKNQLKIKDKENENNIKQKFFYIYFFYIIIYTIMNEEHFGPIPDVFCHWRSVGISTISAYLDSQSE